MTMFHHSWRYTVRSLYDGSDFHEIRWTLMLKVEESVLILTIKSVFEDFHSISHNFDFKFLLFWIRAKNTPKKEPYRKCKKSIVALDGM